VGLTEQLTAVLLPRR